MSEVWESALVDAPVDHVLAIFDAPEHWLGSVATAAGEAGAKVHTRLRAQLGGQTLRTLRASKRASVRLGPPEVLPGRAILPLVWEAEGFAGLFPIMEGMLEITPGLRNRALLVFWGRYDPPLRQLGRTVDRLVAQRVAEATVRDFLERIQEYAEAPYGRNGRSPRK